VSRVSLSCDIDFKMYLVACRFCCCDGVGLPSQNCGLGPIVRSPGDSDVDLVDEIG
jgi:hypothetical protein